ncbi:MAG TPA: hypothetical protein VE985_11860 [Gaiellaceae bacterium]|nr:hypothetical protein [Gaiellaceae bacterium]
MGVPKLGAIIPRRLPPFVVYDAFDYANGQNISGLWGVKSDGSDPQELSPSDPSAIEPSWSPNGRRILYSTGCVIWVMNPFGVVALPLIATGADCRYGGVGAPRWGPRGRRIVYTSGAGPMIHIANADGSHGHRVPHTQGASDVSFSPDGRYIMFDVRQGGGFRGHLYVIRPNGTGLREINARYTGVDPSWSPDGTRITYACAFYRNPVPPASGPVVQVPFPVPHAVCEISRAHPRPRTLTSVPSGDEIGSQTWSADGKTILLTISGPYDATSQIAVLSPFGGTPVEITHTGYNSDPDW